MKAVASERRRFGYRRIHVMLQRQGIEMNIKKLRRLYGEERLQVRKRGGRKRALGTRRPMLVPDRPNQRWSLDFISDSFTDGRRFRVLTVVVMNHHDPANAALSDDGYLGPARAILSDHAYLRAPGSGHPEFLRTPGYPLFIAALLWIGRNRRSDDDHRLSPDPGVVREIFDLC